METRAQGSEYEKNLDFRTGDFTDIGAFEGHKFDALYSRFTLHSVHEAEEERVLRDALVILPIRGLFMIEVRTIHDPLFGIGNKVGDNEYVTDHFRRFVTTTKFLKKCIDYGWTVKFFVESDGLAKYKDEDPVVARYVLEKY